jgi:hypothetical protein
VLNADYIYAQDFHGCVFYQQFAEADLSQWFVAELLGCIEQLKLSRGHNKPVEIDCIALQQQSKAFITRLKQQYQISDENRIKPGIGEATRVLLRRVPDLVILRDKNDAAVTHLSILAKEKQVSILYQADLPYRAVSLIKDVS